MVGDGLDLLDTHGAEPLAVVADIVKPGMFVRMNEQSIDIGAVGWLAFSVSVIGLWLYFANSYIEKQNMATAASLTRVANYRVQSSGGTNADTGLVGLPASTSTPERVVVEIMPVVITPTPQATAAVTPTFAPGYYQTVDVLYSYYNPALGGVNCHTDNWNGSTCADTTASGIRWSEYLGKGVAIPPSWKAAGIGYGSVFHVLEPAALVGDYTVVDLCSGCEANIWPDGMYRLDFLNDRQLLSWAYPVKIELRVTVP